MNFPIKTLVFCVIIGTTHSSLADTTVTVKASSPWLGYMNVSYLPVDGGGNAFSSGWGVPDLRATFSGTELTLSPNTINPSLGLNDAYWYNSDRSGNKIMEANMYVEVSDGSLSGQTVTFTGNITENTLTPDHTAFIFIKDFDSNYSLGGQTVVPVVEGAFSISLEILPGQDRRVQYGFQTTGVNVWAEDVAPFGSVKIAATGIVPGNPIVKVDPAAAWQGYINVFNIPEIAGNEDLVNGYAQPVTTELRAAFSPAGLNLSPFTINPPDGLENPEWYEADGSGNKNIDANLYVQPQDGTLSGQTVVFSGDVAANSLTGSHTTIAFIKEFVADYSSFTVESVVLAPGPFSISLAISNDISRHVQYGFQTLGPNVWPASAGPFGSVRVGTDLSDSYATWIARFDFTSFAEPDLTEMGDPDGDGQNNITEFALNGNPARGAVSGKVHGAAADLSGENAFLLTLPIFNGASFAGSPAPTGTVGELSYTIEGSNGLVVFDQAVSEVSPAVTTGLPVLDAGWTYRSFRLDGAVGGASPRGPTGFLRARIVKTP